MHRIWAGPASPAKGFFWHSIVLPQLADVVSNVAALLKATEDILTMVDLPEPAEKMHLPIPNVDLAHCNPQAWGGSLRSSLAPMWLEAFGLKGSNSSIKTNRLAPSSLLGASSLAPLWLEAFGFKGSILYIKNVQRHRPHPLQASVPPITKQ